ncbi:hypothetical protein FRC11_013583, partial [Ceratobasidium sp. 423]
MNERLSPEVAQLYNKDTKKRSQDGGYLNDTDPSPGPSLKRPRIDEGPETESGLRRHDESRISVSERRITVINSAMRAGEIVIALGQYGCRDLGPELNPRSCSEHPIYNGGLGDIYKGELDGLRVAIKTTRMYVMNNDEKYLK